PESLTPKLNRLTWQDRTKPEAGISSRVLHWRCSSLPSRGPPPGSRHNRGTHRCRRPPDTPSRPPAAPPWGPGRTRRRTGWSRRRRPCWRCSSPCRPSRRRRWAAPAPASEARTPAGGTATRTGRGTAWRSCRPRRRPCGPWRSTRACRTGSCRTPPRTRPAR
ncbi:Os02g0756850, partial [Oryza sativa Japonica Group]